MPARTALIFGVSGQDGAYLSRLLLDKNYAVHGVSRDATQPFTRLHRLGIRDRVTTHSASLRDERELRALIDEVRPDEIYNLTGVTSVAQSFADPAATTASIAGAQELLLRVAHESGAPIRIYQSSSTDCFGEVPSGHAADEDTPFAPRSPYAEAKVRAFRMTADARQRWGVFAVSGGVGHRRQPRVAAARSSVRDE